MRLPPSALARISARPIVSPCGFDQSSGALSVAHRQSLPGAGESAVALQRPQESFCAVREAGSAAVVVPDGPDDGAADALVLPPAPPFLSPDDEPPPQPATSSAAAAPNAVHRTNRAIRLPP